MDKETLRSKLIEKGPAYIKSLTPLILVVFSYFGITETYQKAETQHLVVNTLSNILEHTPEQQLFLLEYLNEESPKNQSILQYIEKVKRKIAALQEKDNLKIEKEKENEALLALKEENLQLQRKMETEPVATPEIKQQQRVLKSKIESIEQNIEQKDEKLFNLDKEIKILNSDAVKPQEKEEEESINSFVSYEISRGDYQIIGYNSGHVEVKKNGETSGIYNLHGGKIFSLGLYKNRYVVSTSSGDNKIVVYDVINNEEKWSKKYEWFRNVDVNTKKGAIIVEGSFGRNIEVVPLEFLRSNQ